MHAKGWDVLRPMAETYVVWVQDREAAKGMPYFSLIDEDLYGPSDPVVGLAYDPRGIYAESAGVQASSSTPVSSALAAMPEAVVEKLTQGTARHRQPAW